MTRLQNIFLRLREQFSVWFSRTFIVVLLAFLFLVAIGGISHNSKWQIVQVNVVGVNTISPDAVRALALEKILGNYFLVYSRGNSYLFPVGEIEQSLLDAFPRIETVSVSRIDDHSIIINISERKPYALWCGEEFQSGVRALTDCWFVDRSGFVFDRAPVFSDGVYFEIYGKLAEKNIGDPLRASVPYDRFSVDDSFIRLLQAQVGDTLRVNLKSNGESELTFRSSTRHPFLAGTVIRFTDEQSAATLVKNLVASIPAQFPDNLALKKKLVYIDMRFGNKIFFGFEN